VSSNLRELQGAVRAGRIREWFENLEQVLASIAGHQAAGKDRSMIADVRTSLERAEKLISTMTIG